MSKINKISNAKNNDDDEDFPDAEDDFEESGPDFGAPSSGIISFKKNLSGKKTATTTIAPVAAADASDSETDGDSDASAASDDDDDDDDGDISEVDSEVDPNDDEQIRAKTTTGTNAKTETLASKFGLGLSDDDDDEDDDDDDDEHYLQKFDQTLKQNIIAEYHPELKVHNNDEVESLSRIVKDENGNIVDPLHRTMPFITKYEKARVLGERAKQLNSGAKPFIEIDAQVLDGYLIALKEFEQKKIPFIVKRPLPNGGCEYWKLRDLEIL